MNGTAINSSSESNQTLSPIDAVNAILKEYAAGQPKTQDKRDEFLLAAALMQSAQKLFTFNSARLDKLQLAAAQVFTALSSLPWNSVPFPIAQTLLSQTYADIFTEHNVRDADKYRILLESLYTFLVLAQDSPELIREDVLRSIVADGARSVQAAKSPELNYRANVLKIFTPNKVAAIDLEPLHVVIYRGELMGGGFGPELWGLAYVKGDDAHVLLETGEYVKIHGTSLCLAVTKDYDTSELPPYLLACAKLFIPTMILKLAGDAELKTTVEKLDKVFGSFSQPIPQLLLPEKEIESCENILDKARWASHDTGAEGAMRTFDITGTDLQVIITAQQSRVRPYVTSTLVQAGNGTIYMRLDVPREFSARGVYFFPLGAKSVSLIIE
jgi:hypothetical protein